MIKMKQPTDKEIIKWIENKKFSQLCFLDDCWRTSDNPKHIGFYYFIQLQKGENVDEVWYQILQQKTNESDAYLYLGEIGQEIYNSIDKRHICSGFYRKSIGHNKNNAQALWDLYYISKKDNDLLLLRSLTIDFELGNTDEINFKLSSIYINQYFGLDFSNEDWCMFKKILLNSKTRKKDEWLIITYYNLGEIELGLKIIHQLDGNNLSYEVLKPYLDAGKITQKEVANKVYDFHAGNVFEDNYIAIFLHEKMEFEKDRKKHGNKEYRISKSNVIASAFRAKAYSEVIELFEDKNTDDFYPSFIMKPKLHYLISQLLDGVALNKEIHNNIITLRDRLIDDEEKTLFKILKAHLYISEIKRDIQDEKIKYHSNNNHHFNSVNEIVHDDGVIAHLMHSSLKEEISTLSKKWNDFNEKKECAELDIKINSGEYDLSELKDYISALMNTGEYQKAIDAFALLEEKIPFSMSQFNQLGVCYGHLNDNISAYENYRLALNDMIKSKQYNHTLISNYIFIINKLSDIELTKEDFDSLKKFYNMALCNCFYFHTFTLKKRSFAFKYQPFNINTIDSLTNQYFYLANKEQLNDPIEMPLLDLVGGDALMCSDYRICSLTNNNNSMLMWSHYAEQHQGIMVEYWFGGELPDGVGINKISYDNAKSRTDNQYVFNQYLLTKNKDWKYENEVRLFTHKKEKLFYETYNYPDINLNKINARVATITLGLKFPKDKIELMKNIIQGINRDRCEHIPPITLKQAELDPNNQFELIYNPVV